MSESRVYSMWLAGGYLCKFVHLFTPLMDLLSYIPFNEGLCPQCCSKVSLPLFRDLDACALKEKRRLLNVFFLYNEP